MKPIFTLTALFLAIALALWTVGHTDAQIEAKVVDQPPVGVESREPLKAFSTPERESFFKEMLPHLRDELNKQNESLADALVNYDYKAHIRRHFGIDPPLAKSNQVGFFGAGLVASGIVTVVIYALEFILVSLLWMLVVHWFKAHWLGALIALGVYFVINTIWILVIAKLSCRAARS